MRCTTIAVLTMSGLALLAGCRRNQAPSRPELSGPSSARPGDTVWVAAVSEDPEGGEVAYKFAWGDTGAVAWTDYYASGQPVTRSHVYADTGTHILRVTARDMKEAESELSDEFAVRVGYALPGVPERPEGPESCYVREDETYRTSAVHPEGDSLQFQFDWAGEVGDWSGFVASESTCSEVHRFDTTGVFEVRARARDARGLISGWSEELEVTVVERPGAGPEPQNVRISAASDSTVLAMWSPPQDTVPDAYRLYFMAVRDTFYALIAETTDTMFEHDPAGRTGSYRVAAVYDTSESAAGATPSTVPVFSDTVVVAELNSPGFSGYGWKESDGEAATYDMSSHGSTSKVDCYVTDFAAGDSGPTYFVASPDTAPLDPGGVAPTGNWKNNHFTDSLPSEERLPADTGVDYSGDTELTSVPFVLGCHTANGYYAMVKVLSVDVESGEVRVQSWFQRVQGLRLIQH